MKTIIQEFNLLSLEQCEKLPTHRLLAYYKSRRYLRDVGGEYYGDWDEPLNKEANEYMDAIKKILDSREHIN